MKSTSKNSSLCACCRPLRLDFCMLGNLSWARPRPRKGSGGPGYCKTCHLGFVFVFLLKSVGFGCLMTSKRKLARKHFVFQRFGPPSRPLRSPFPRASGRLSLSLSLSLSLLALRASSAPFQWFGGHVCFRWFVVHWVRLRALPLGCLRCRCVAFGGPIEATNGDTDLTA